MDKLISFQNLHEIFDAFKKNKTLFAITLILCACSCTTRKDTPITITAGKIYSFSSKYIMTNSSTEVLNGADGETLICSFNTKTFKQIDLYTLDGKLIKTISLKNILKNGVQIDDIAASSPDSFWVLSQYHNILYLINGEGDIVKQTTINNSPVDSMRTELGSSGFSNFLINDSTFLWNAGYYFKRDDTAKQSFSLEDFYRVNNALPYFLKIQSPFSKAPKVSFGLTGFYTHISGKGDIVGTESAIYNYTPKGILLTSWYTDSVFLIDTEDFSIKKSVKVVSKYTKIGCEPMTVTELRNGLDISTRLRPSGIIIRMYYDTYRDLFYVVAKHKAEAGAVTSSHFLSLFIYDQDFKLKNEIKMDDRILYPGSIYIIKEGLLISKKDNKEKNKNQQYQLFHVEKN